MSGKIKELNTSRHIVTHNVVSRGRLRYALVKANPKDYKAYCDQSGFSTLIIDSVKSLASDVSSGDFAMKLADAIEQTLTKRVKSYPDLFHVGYVGLTADNGLVSGCTVGNTRVNLIKNGELFNITNDHNLIDDPIEGAEIDMDDHSFRYTESRQILALRDPSVKHQAEPFSWELSENSMILVCSSAFHKFREPSEYIEELLAFAESDKTPTGYNPGLISILNPFG